MMDCVSTAASEYSVVRGGRDGSDENAAEARPLTATVGTREACMSGVG